MRDKKDEIVSTNPVMSDHLKINYRIIDDKLGFAGAKTKFSRNIDIICTLKTIEKENRLANLQEQEIL